ncbi:hypothetical protein BV898_01421 [Hypsibius exemplaris]|uniref:Gustatory receptor n=1 Tax=Hypsibius exemplaris TaxID=2072580 RepID=A0A1W0XBE9_HYPEX|nr:hypothetical protein BV898_01421 [Hypsibius exemplaris]
MNRNKNRLDIVQQPGHKIRTFPEALLGVFGYLPFQTRYPFLTILCRVVCCSHVLCAAVSFVALGINGVAYMLHRSSHNASSFVKFVAFIPVFTVYGRAFIVLLIFLSKQEEYHSLHRASLEIAASLLPDSDGLKRCCNGWRRNANRLGVATIVFHTIWQLSTVIGNLISAGINGPPKNNSTAVAQEDFEKKLRLIIPYGLVYMSQGFYVSLYGLSQQVVTLGIVFAMMLRFFIKANNDAIGKLQLAIQNNPNASTERSHEIDFPSTLKEHLIDHLEMIRRTQAVIRKFCADLDAFFRNIGFACHMLDQATVMGFVATVIISNHHDTNLPTWIYNCLSIIFFVGYSTILLLPLASVFDEAESTNLRAYELSVAVRRCFPDEPSDSQIHEILQDIMSSSEQNSIVLQGAGFINFTRPLFAGTVTFGLSFSVVAYEITQRSNNISSCS